MIYVPNPNEAVCRAHGYILPHPWTVVNKNLKETFKGSGGSGSPAGIKLQFAFDLISSTFAHFDITQGNVPDQKYTHTIPTWLKKGDLILFDLGYFCISVLSKIAQAKAFFVSRYLHGTSIYIKVENNLKKNQLDLNAQKK